MNQPVHITFRNIPPSEFIEARIREKASKLEQFYDHIMSLKVVVESPHQHKKKGNLFHICIDLSVPEGELVVNRKNTKHHAHENIYVAIRDAFDAARRQLQEYARKRRGKVKTHQAPLHGMVTEIISGEDYGRIETQDGHEVYFHRNSIIGENYDGLEIGDAVRFSEEMGNDGPQASTVHMIGKHHIVDRIH